MLQKIKRLDAFLDAHSAALVIAALALIARIPNLNEPYWYGDEAIYLTLGQAINKGYTLYSQIIDHKTPLIYYLARVGTQLNFRMLNMAWNTVSIILFYTLAFRLFRRRIWATVATVLFALLTTMPWLEGNIPNGELFVLGFVLAGATFLGTTQYWRRFFTVKLAATDAKPISPSRRDAVALFLSGTCFSLGILTKVPALFDLAAFLAIGYFAVVSSVIPAWFATWRARTDATFAWRKQLLAQLQPLLWILGGVAVPILLSILYFTSQGAGTDYLQFGLLYNFRYAGTWNLDITNPLLAFFFTLPGKLSLLAILMLKLTLLNKRISRVAQFSLAWFGLALVACLLSNRPYSHYFIQLIAPGVLVLTLGLQQLANKLKPAHPRTLATDQFSWITLLMSAVSTGLVVWVLVFLKVGIYPAIPYYQRWIALAQGKLSQDEYRQSFEGLMRDNYAFSAILKAEQQDKLFIWGTDPGLYALSNTTPTGRFTVSFHIKDFNAYEETYRDLVADAPTYIVMMRNEQTYFAQLDEYLNVNYRPTIQQFEHFTVWKRKPTGTL